MARFVDEKEDGLRSLACLPRDAGQLKASSSKLAQRILHALAAQPRYSHELAKTLGVHEQKVYYHVRKLENAGLIKEERRSEVQGGSAKYYELAAPSFAVLFAEPRETTKITTTGATAEALLAPFITNGKPEFLIVVGSPEPHGPSMARAKDGSYAIDVAVFLGSFLAERPGPVVKLDTELREEELRQNLIVIGGPIVNTVTARLNEKLPLRFTNEGRTIRSTTTGNEYESDEIGVIVKMKNPFAPTKGLLFIAGRSRSGTKAAILALLRHFDELAEAAVKRQGLLAKVVEGKDLDSDGVVDEITFRE